MSTRYRNVQDNQRAHIDTLRTVIACLVLIVAALVFELDQARQNQRLHIPPDLRQGALVKVDDPKPWDVYAFTQSILEVLNHWQDNGAVDYQKAIEMVKPYLTPKFYAQLQYDLKKRLTVSTDGTGTTVDELTDRVRTMQPIPGEGYNDQRVDLLGNGTWQVQLNMHIDEEVRGMNVKSINVQYPVKVVRLDADPNTNPWGLALDGYAEPGPKRLADPSRSLSEHLGVIPTQRPKVKP